MELTDEQWARVDAWLQARVSTLELCYARGGWTVHVVRRKGRGSYVETHTRCFPGAALAPVAEWLLTLVGGGT